MALGLVGIVGLKGGSPLTCLTLDLTLPALPNSGLGGGP